MRNFIKSVCCILLVIAGNGLFAQNVSTQPGGPCPNINVNTIDDDNSIAGIENSSYTIDVTTGPGPGPGPCTCDNIHPTFTYSTSADCITTFVGTINIACADFNVLYEWTIDGNPVGSGAVFSYALGNGPHVVCLKVTIAINGQICQREWCREIVIECDPCTCEHLIPNFLYTIDKCVGHFTATPELPCCIKDIKYDWYIDGVYQFTGQNFSHTFLSNGTYNVCLFITGTLTNGMECHKEICQFVEIKDCDECHCDQLKPSFTYDIFQCEGHFTGIIDAPECMSNFTYEWTVNGIPSGTGPTLAYTFPFNGPYHICLFVTATLPDGTICTAEVCKTIEVTDCDPCNCDNIQVVFEYWNDKCEYHFTGFANVPSCMQIVAWEWTVDGMPAGSGPTFDYTFTSNGVHTICLMITTVRPDGTYCHKKFCKTIDVKDCDECNCDQLLVNFNYEIDKCNVHLFADVSGPECMQDYQYLWTVNGNPAGTSPNIVWTAPTNGTYTICLYVTVTLPDGTQCQRQYCKDITVTDCGNCTCEGLTIGYNYQVSQCVGHFSAFWTLPQCTQSYSVDWYVNSVYAGSGATFAYTFPASGVYQVCAAITVTLTNGTVCPLRSCRMIEVNCPQTGCECSQLNGNFNFQVNGCVITAQALPQIPACMTHPSFTWTVNSAFAGSGPNLNYTVSGSGMYIVCLKIVAVKPNGQKCEKTICKDVFVGNCIGTPTGPTDPTNPQGLMPNNPTMEESLSLYPNPASTELNIDFTTIESGTVTISFKTTDGKEILNQAKDLDAGDHHLKFPISPMLSDEIMFVEVTSGAEKIIRKVSVSKR